MEIERVVSILDSLAAGMDPATGTAIPMDTFHSPDVIRALFAASSALKDGPPRTRPRAGAAGTRWSEDEDLQLCRDFDEGVPVDELARDHGRSRAAITLRLVKLGRLDPATVRVRERGMAAS